MVVSIKTGPFGTVLKAAEYSHEGVPLISVGEVGHGSLRVGETTPRAPREVVERLPEYLLESGDIVFGRKGAVERSAVVKPEQTGWFLGSDGIRLRPPNTCDARFIGYYFQSQQARSWLVQHATGTTMPSLSQSIIERAPIVLPPLAEQRAIVRVLGSLDDKIELNRRMNETLEAMANALFKSWFVDFDPVRARAEGRDSALPNHIAGLLPNGLVDSGVGEIPRGWSVMPLDEIADFLNGLALQKFPPADGMESLPVIKIAQLRAGGSDKAYRASSMVPLECVVHDSDVLFSWSGSLECRIWCGGTGALNQHLFRVTSIEYPKWFYYHWVLRHLPAFREIAAGKATTMGHIQRHHLSSALVVVPPQPLLEWIGGHMEPMIDRQVSCQLESRELAELRDALLPRLVSGQLRMNRKCLV